MGHINEQILKQIKSTEFVVKDVSEGDMPWSATSGSSEPNMGEPAEPAAV
jgi:hypothetical protein